VVTKCVGTLRAMGRFVHGMLCPWDTMSWGRFVLGTLRYENLGDGLSQGRFVRGRIVRVPNFTADRKRLWPDFSSKGRRVVTAFTGTIRKLLNVFSVQHLGLNFTSYHLSNEIFTCTK
jgi:hypothetical protein